MAEIQDSSAAREARAEKLADVAGGATADGAAADGATLVVDWAPNSADGGPSAELEGKDATELYNDGVDHQDAEDHAAALRCFGAALLQGYDADTLVARGNSFLETSAWASAAADYTAALRGEPLDFFRHATKRLVELGALTADGIFRLAGSNDDVSAMMEQLRAGAPPHGILSACDEVNDAATFLGRWLREQPMVVPVDRFAECDALLAAAADGAACEEFVGSLPEPGQGLLRALIGFLQRVDAEATRMTPDNLSRVFAMTLIYRDDPMDMMTHVVSDASFVSLLIQKLPRSWWSDGAESPAGDDEEDEEEDEEELQSIYFSRGVASLELAVFNRRNALDASGGGDALASALRDLQQATKLGPEDADAWAYLARAESAKGDHVAAVASNEKALSLGVAEGVAVAANLERAKRRAQAASLASAGGAAERLRLLRESVVANPTDLESLLQCGEALLELGTDEVVEASGCAEKARALPGAAEDGRPLLLLAQVCGKWSDWSGAAEHYAKAAALASSGDAEQQPRIKAAATAGLGLAHLRQGHHEEAVRVFNEAEELYELLPCAPERSLLLNRGNARQRVGDLAGAYEDFDAALALDGEYAAAHLARGTVMGALQQEDAAEADYSSALECAQQQQVEGEGWTAESGVVATALMARANLRAKCRRHAEAVADYTALLALVEAHADVVDTHVDAAEALLARGQVHVDMGAHSAAHADLLAVLAKTAEGVPGVESAGGPKLARHAHAALGNLYQIQGDYVKAMESFSQAAALAESAQGADGDTPGGTDGNAEQLRMTSHYSQHVASAAAPMRGSVTAAVAAGQTNLASAAGRGSLSGGGAAAEDPHASLRQLVSRLCQPSSLLPSWQYVDELTDDPAARRARQEQDAFLLGYPSFGATATAAEVLRLLYGHYTDTHDTDTGTGRAARASEQLRVLQLLHAWLDPAQGYPEDILVDESSAPGDAVVGAAEIALQRIITAVSEAADETALLKELDGVGLMGASQNHKNGGPLAAEALLQAIEMATAGGGLRTNRKARMLAVPRLFSGSGGGSETTPPPAVNSSWSTEQWSSCELWSGVGSEEVARQLCRMEQRVYCAITPRQLLALSWRGPNDRAAAALASAPNGDALAMSSAAVTRALLHHENLARAVRGSILSQPDISKRAAIVGVVLTVMQQLLHYDNYGSAAALHKALSSPAVLRLAKTRAALKPAARNNWKEYIDSAGDETLVRQTTAASDKATASPMSEAALREAYEKAVPPKVPYLQPYLRDLLAIDSEEDGNSGRSGETDAADEQEEEQQRAAMLEVIGEIALEDARTACEEAGLPTGDVDLATLRARLRSKYERRGNWRRLQRMRPVIASATAGVSVGYDFWDVLQVQEMVRGLPRLLDADAVALSLATEPTR